jgi:hypothetical protein
MRLSIQRRQTGRLRMTETENTFRQVLDRWERLPPEYRSDFVISFEIIKEAMGIEWLKKRFDPDLKKPSIFKLSHGVSEEEATRNYRVYYQLFTRLILDPAAFLLQRPDAVPINLGVALLGLDGLVDSHNGGGILCR